MIKKGFSDAGVFFLGLLSYLPLSVLYGFSSLLYYPLYYIAGYRRKVVRKNLVNSFPERSIEEIIKIEKEFYRHFVDMIFENIKLHSISKEQLLDRVHFKNLEELDLAFKQGKNALASSGHYGNWEMISLALSVRNVQPTLVIYKPLNNLSFERWYKNWRTKFGAVFVPMRHTLRAMMDFKGKNYMLCFAFDQSPVREEARYFVDFLHQPTAALLGLEKIARKTNDPIFHFTCTRVGRGRYEVSIDPIFLEPAKTAEHEITNTTFKILEDIINRDPAYWLWSHNRWKHQPQHLS